MNKKMERDISMTAAPWGGELAPSWARLIETAFFEDIQDVGDITTDAVFNNGQARPSGTTENGNPGKADAEHLHTKTHAFPQGNSGYEDNNGIRSPPHNGEPCHRNSGYEDNNGNQGTYYLVAKQDGVLCGAVMFIRSFEYIDASCRLRFHFADGDILKSGDIVATVQGSIHSMLKAERTALNFISHLSGIATLTRSYVDAAKASGNARIMDTRKTLPGWRSLQKYAVRCGGGTNHRMGLYDMVMIKDNHIDGAGGITPAVLKVRQCWGDRFKVEVETRNLQEVQEALDAGVDVIMLDNMDETAMKEAVGIIAGRAATEASGNMNLERIPSVAGTGVDAISVGALTHSAPVFDFSFRKRGALFDSNGIYC
ncbi:MAG: carboxylating nicotinate-nucleotide diphosphorylase [Desulfamplus sp.]|nr:carboxylating nicotinate-nucleotide diphosphorylase [Desulfamplus sp.]